MIRVFFPERCRSWKRWPRWCFAIMLCGSEQLQSRIACHAVARRRRADPGFRNDRLGSAWVGSIRNSDDGSRAREEFRCRQSTIRNSISGRLATLAGRLHFFWLTVASVRAVGALAEGQARSRPRASAHDAQDATSRALEVRRRFLSESDDRVPALATSLARLKNSLELGLLGSVFKGTDPISQRTYETLEKAGSVLSSPERAEKFLTFPGARELSEHPKIVALRSDPEIADLIAERRFVDLLQNPRVIDAANDPVVAERVRKFDIQRALDYALEQNSSTAKALKR